MRHDPLLPPMGKHLGMGGCHFPWRHLEMRILLLMWYPGSQKKRMLLFWGKPRHGDGSQRKPTCSGTRGWVQLLSRPGEREKRKKRTTRWKQGLFPPHTQVNYYNYSSLSLASTSCCCLWLMPDFFLPTPPSFSAALQQHQVVFLQLSRNRKYSGGGVSCGAVSQCRPVKAAGLFLAFLQHYSLVKAQTFKQRFREILKFWAID